MANKRLKNQLSGLFSDLDDLDDLGQSSKSPDPEERENSQATLADARDEPFPIELQTVATISDLTTTIFDLDKLLKLIVDLIKVNLNLYHVQVYLLDEDTENPFLTPLVGSGAIGLQMKERGHTIPLDSQDDLVARALRNKREEVDNNLYGNIDFTPDSLLPGVRAELAVPLIIIERAIGALDVYSEAPNHFKPQNIPVYATFAAQIVVAVQNTRLLKDAERQAMRLTLLNEMGQDLSAAATLDEIFKVAIRYTSQIIRANQTDIALLTDSGDRLEIFTLQEEAGAVPLGLQLPLEGTALGQAAREKTLVNIPDLPKSDFSDAPNLLGQDLRSLLVAPLTTGEQVIGTLSVGSKTAKAYTVRDENMFLHIATFLGSTIQSKRLFEQTQEVLTATERLYSVSQRINMAAGLDDILAAVAEGLPVGGINRALLFTFEYGLVGEVEAAIVAANWHSGEGMSPFPLGQRYLRAMSTAVRPFLGAEPSFLKDAQNSPDIDPNALVVLKEQNIRALAVLPLWVGARQLGTMVLQGEATHLFTRREIQSYLSVAPQIASAVENGRLLMETRSVLSEIEETQKRYTVQSWQHYRSNFDQNVLGYEQAPEGIMPMGDELPPEISRAISQSQAVIIDGNGHNEGRPPEADEGSSLIVPLTLRDELIGILGLQETEKEHSWFPEEIALVEAIAVQFAQVAEQLRLLDETQRRAAQESQINEIGEKIRGAQSLEEALQIAVKEVGLSLQAPQTRVQLIVD